MEPLRQERSVSIQTRFQCIFHETFQDISRTSFHALSSMKRTQWIRIDLSFSCFETLVKMNFVVTIQPLFLAIPPPLRNPRRRGGARENAHDVRWRRVQNDVIDRVRFQSTKPFRCTRVDSRMGSVMGSVTGRDGYGCEFCFVNEKESTSSCGRRLRRKCKQYTIHSHVEKTSG